MSGPDLGERAAPDRRQASRAARAGLFVALSALAVPACQYYETDGGTERGQAVARVSAPAPAAVAPASAAGRPNRPRA